MTLRMIRPLIYFGRRFEVGETLDGEDELGQAVLTLFPDRVEKVVRDFLSEPIDYLEAPQ